MFKYLEHQADMGIYAKGQSWKEVFEDGARAIFELMFAINKNQLTVSKRINIKINAKDIAVLFVEWLNELIAQKDIENLVFVQFNIIKLEKENGEYILEAEVGGERFDPGKFEQKLEVKAATYSGLKCGERGGKKFCQCIVDV